MLGLTLHECVRRSVADVIIPCPLHVQAVEAFMLCIGFTFGLLEPTASKPTVRVTLQPAYVSDHVYGRT